MSNRYDVQHLSSSFEMFLNGAVVSKTIVHPQQRGRQLELYGFGSTIWEDSVVVVSKSSFMTAHVTAIYVSSGRQQGRTGQHTDEGNYNIHIMLEPREGAREDSSSSSGMIILQLVYSTSMAFWRPRYSLQIRKNDDAILALRASLCRPRPWVWGDSVVSVSNHLIHHLQIPPVSSFTNNGQNEHAVGESMSNFAPYTWHLPPSFAPDPRIEIFPITECLIDDRPATGVLSSRLRAKLNTTEARSLPAGDVHVELPGSPIIPAHMPLWNPEQVLDVEVTLRPKPSFDPVRIGCLLNPISFEGSQINDIVRIEIMAKNEIGAFPRAKNPQAVSNVSPPDQLIHADLNNIKTFEGNRRPISPASNISHTDTDTAEGYRDLWAQGNPVQRSGSDGESFGGPFCHGRLFQHNDSSNGHRTAEETKVALSLMELGSDAFRNPKEGQAQGTVPLNGGQISRPRSLKPSRVPVNLRICKVWKDFAALSWIDPPGHWDFFAAGTVYLIEVLVVGNPEPIHLKAWRGEWKGQFCNGSSLFMTSDEVLRLTDKGGCGQGALLH